MKKFCQSMILVATCLSLLASSACAESPIDDTARSVPNEGTLQAIYEPDTNTAWIEDCIQVPSMADIAEQEWITYTETTNYADKSDIDPREKYLLWFYSARGDEDMSKIAADEPWGSLFVNWCASRAHVGMEAQFVKTNSASRFLQALRRAYSQFTTPESGYANRGDLIFIPYADTWQIGIITETQSDSLTYIAGDINGKLAKISKQILAFPEKTIVTYGLNDGNYLRSFVLKMQDELYLTRPAAVGLLANIQAECSYNYHCVGDGGWAYGLCQWNSGRWTRLVEFCEERDLDWQSLDGQIQFLKHELDTQYETMVCHMNACWDTPDGAGMAASIFCEEFERPKDIAGQCAYRAYLAEQLYKEMFGNP